MVPDVGVRRERLEGLLQIRDHPVRDFEAELSFDVENDSMETIAAFGVRR